MRLATVLKFLGLQNGEQTEILQRVLSACSEDNLQAGNQKIIHLFLSIAAAIVLVLAVLFAVFGTLLIICIVILAFMCYRRRKTKYKPLTQSTQNAHLSFPETKEPSRDSEPSV